MSTRDGAAIGQPQEDDWRDGERFEHLGRRRTRFERGPTDEWLTDYPDAVSRHVETLTIHSPQAAQRHLTIDVVLPRQGLTRSAWHLPLTRLGKKSPTSFIDLRDEAGRTIALPTRTELGAMTRAALRSRIIGLGRDATQQETLEAALTTLVFSEPEHAQLGLSVILEAIDRSHQEVPTRLLETLYQLVDNSIVWIRLAGRPGQRRVLKLAYNIPLVPPVLPARREVSRRMMLVYDLIVKPPEGRIDVRVTLRRMRGRLTGRMGWDAIDVFLDGPVLQDPRSYHLEITPPPGLQITELLLDEDDPGDPAQVSDGNRHMYVRSPRPRASGQVRIKIRADRRGFLNASGASSLVLAALLWLFATHASDVGESAALAPGAAVLLVAPALMAIFVSRPTESALVAAALTGIRTALGICAISSLTAAAALAGARLTDQLYPTLVICAGVASVAAVSIGIAWLGTYHIVRKHSNRLRAFWCGKPQSRRSGSLALGTLACMLLGLWATLGFLGIWSLPHHRRGDALALLGVLVPAAAIWLPRRGGSVPAGVVVTSILALLTALGLAITIVLHDSLQPVSFATQLVALSAGNALGIVAILTALGAELAPVESPSSWALERRRGRFPLLDS